MDADENLYSIIFGESIFNDAIGIVMFQTVNKMGNDPSLSASEEIFSALGRFSTIFIGSVIVGAMLALIASFILKRQTSYVTFSEKNDNKEMS